MVEEKSIPPVVSSYLPAGNQVKEKLAKSTRGNEIPIKHS